MFIRSAFTTAVAAAFGGSDGSFVPNTDKEENNMSAQFAYDYDYLFEPIGSNVAPNLEPNRRPQEKPQEKTGPELRRLKKRRPSARERERASYVAVAKAFAWMAFVIALVGTFCNSLVECNVSRIELQNTQKELAMYKEETVVLRDKLSKLVSANNIDKIAVEKLGLVKVASSNEVYLDTGKENKVIVSQKN